MKISGNKTTQGLIKTITKEIQSRKPKDLNYVGYELEITDKNGTSRLITEENFGDLRNVSMLYLNNNCYIIENNTGNILATYNHSLRDKAKIYFSLVKKEDLDKKFEEKTLEKITTFLKTLLSKNKKYAHNFTTNYKMSSGSTIIESTYIFNKHTKKEAITVSGHKYFEQQTK